MWRHSLDTAHLAKAITEAECADKDTVEAAFKAGLLHDVGKFVLATQMPREYHEILDKVRNGKGTVYAMEKRELGVSHAGVGAYLLGLWGLDPVVVDAIFSHHEPSRSWEGFTPALAVHVANTLQHEFVVLHPGYRPCPMDMDWIEAQGLGGRVDAWREACRTYIDGSGESEV